MHVTILYLGKEELCHETYLDLNFTCANINFHKLR
jgi:hypothetical protein